MKTVHVAVLQALLEKAGNDPDPRVRWSSIASVVRVGVGNNKALVCHMLIGGLSDSNGNVRAIAAWGLGRIRYNSKEGIKALLEQLNHDQDKLVQEMIVESLGCLEIKDMLQLQQVILECNRRQSDRNRGVSEAAKRATKRLLVGNVDPSSFEVQIPMWRERSWLHRPLGVSLVAGLALVAVILGITWVSGIPPFNSFFAALGSAVTFIAAFLAILGLTLRDLWKQSETPKPY